jgi:hypothetical protein
MQTAMRIHVGNSLARVAVTGAIAMTTLCCDATQSYPVVDICNVLGNMNEFDGKMIELRSEVRFTAHGNHLLGSRCSELGSLGLSIDDEQYKEEKVVSFLRKILSQGGRGSVTLVGHLVRKPFNNFKGYFVLQDVIEVQRR